MDVGEIVSFIIFEAIISIVAFIAALLGAWNIFAAFAFWCIIFPLWIIAGSAVISVYSQQNEEKHDE